MSLSLRPLTAGDAQAAADLVSEHRAFHDGVADRVTSDDMLGWWRRVDATVGVIDKDGRLVGAGSVRRRGPNLIVSSVVHPAARGRGAGTLLLDWSEQRAAEAAVSAVHTAATARDAAGKALFESRGYRYIRSFYRMAIEFDDVPPAPVWPDGFIVASAPADEHVMYETLEEAFADQWGHQPRSFEEWTVQDGPLDERLCYIVRREDGTPTAAEICDEDRFGSAWIDTLGVRPAWRRHGLGEALLRQAFHDLCARGRKRIVLAVDAENTTGATRLYERVGMHVELQDDAYEKQLELRD